MSFTGDGAGGRAAFHYAALGAPGSADDCASQRDPQRKAERGIMNNCPFCKTHEVLLADYTSARFKGNEQAFVQCQKCGAEGPVCATTLEAIQKWNGAKR